MNPAATTTITQPDMMTRDAPLAATSWNEAERTLEVVFSTGAPVERCDRDGPFEERLALNQDWTSFVGCPVLNSHKRYDLRDVLGSVLSARTVGTQARATIRLSRRPDVEPIIQDIRDGHLRGVSIGYTVQEWAETTTPQGVRVRSAIRWTPLELSIVPIAADPTAQIRSEHVKPNATTPTTPIVPVPPTAFVAPAVPPAAVPEAGTAAIDRAAVNAEIRTIGRLSNLDQLWIDTQIDASATVEMARAAAFAAMQARSATQDVRTTQIVVGVDHADPEGRVHAAGEAIYARYTPGHQVSERARQYVGLTTLDLARDCLRLRSIGTTGMSAGSIIERALHTTSDFPLILGEGINRTLREAYRAAPSGLKRVARQTTAKDFRDKNRLALSEAPRLEKVNESGEFTSGTLAEDKASYKLAVFGRIISLSRPAIVNDDLGAFADLARRMGQAAAATEAQLLADLLLSGSGNGPTMSDGNPLFHAAHKNKASGGTAISVSSLSSARTAMRKQVGISGELIEMEPKWLVVPPELETAAEQVLAGLVSKTATKVSDVNPFAGKLGLAVEPRLTSATRWYVAADPAVSDGLEYSYLEGQEGVQIETQYGFEVDGVKIRARLDFGAGFVDWRSWHMDPGA